MLSWVKRFAAHYLLYGVLLLVLCLGIFPFVVLYTSSMTVARLLDRVAPGQGRAQRLDDIWTRIGKPYDYLVSAVG